MFITQEQLNAVLDRAFIDKDGKIMDDFNDTLIRIIDVHTDLKDKIAKSMDGDYSFAFEALKRYALPWLNEITGGEIIEGLTNLMLVTWLYKNDMFAIDVLRKTIDYIYTIRNAKNTKEDTTMKNNIIENIELTEEEERFCAECGCVITGEGHEVDGDWFCDDCFEREFTTCEKCGEIIRKDDDYCYDGDYYCEDCFNELFAVCERCGDLEYRDDMQYVDCEDGYVCEHCLDRYYTQCERCEDWVRNSDVGTVHISDDGDTEQWCDHCIEWHTWNCEECGDCYSDDVNHDDDYICPECSRAGCCNTGNIDTWHSPKSRLSYHFKPLPCMCATEAEKAAAGPDWARKLVFNGLELEIDRREKCYEEDEWSEKIVDKLPTTYCKTDCSLDKGGSYSGIEIVSHPATLAWYMEHKQDFADCFDMLKEGGWLSHDAGTCGLHVHISLHPMEEQNPYAVHNMLIVYDRFWDKLVKFSRRTESQLDHWAQRYHATSEEYRHLKNMAKAERNRYMAVNLQNAHTVEIRMFRGTLNTETFFATLQLVDIITKKCIELGNDICALQKLTWDELVSSDYAELNSYLERRGLKPGSVELPEPPESNEPEPAELKVGDRVRAIHAPDNNDALVGRIGTVVDVIPGQRLNIGVDFGMYITDGRGNSTHRLGALSNNTGWWCEASALELVTEEAPAAEEDLFIPGMWVQLSADARWDRDMPDMGVIVDVISDQIGIELAGWHGGHDCNGHTRDSQGWYFNREFVTPVYAE